MVSPQNNVTRGGPIPPLATPLTTVLWLFWIKMLVGLLRAKSNKQVKVESIQKYN